MAVELLILAFFAIVGVFILRIFMGGGGQEQMPPMPPMGPPMGPPMMPPPQGAPPGYDPYGPVNPYPQMAYYEPPKRRVIVVSEKSLAPKKRRRRI